MREEINIEELSNSFACNMFQSRTLDAGIFFYNEPLVCRSVHTDLTSTLTNVLSGSKELMTARYILAVRNTPVSA